MNKQLDANSSTNITIQVIDNLIQEVEKTIASGVVLNNDRQDELAKLLIILRRTKKICSQLNLKKQTNFLCELDTLVLMTRVAIDALFKQKAILLAKRLRWDAELTLRRIENPFSWMINGYQRFLQSTSIPVKVLLGLAIALPIYVGLPWSLLSTLSNAKHKLIEWKIVSESISVRNTDTPGIYIEDFNEAVSLVTLSMVAGATGSIISILTRLDEYSDQKLRQRYEGYLSPVFVGLFKPIVGGAFGVFIFAVTSSQLLPMVSLTNPTTRTRTDIKWLTVLSITFVTGFSERLAKDLIRQTEDRLTRSQEYKTTVSTSEDGIITVSGSSTINDLPKAELTVLAQKSEDSTKLLPQETLRSSEQENVDVAETPTTTTAANPKTDQIPESLVSNQGNSAISTSQEVERITL
jgi:hypothetical protein